MTDILNDLSFPQESGAPQTIDARDFFPRIKLDIVSHNNNRVFCDIKSGKWKTLDITNKLTITIKKTKKKSLEDLFNHKKYSTNILSIFSKDRIIRMNPISLLQPLQKTPFNTLDVRLCEILSSTRKYPDIYTLSLPFSRRTKKILKKHKKRIAISSIVFVSLIFSIILLSLAAKTYIEKETIRNYNRIAALKDMRDMEVISQEVREIHDSFKKIALIFSPFETALDNRFYSHPQVHLASNIIHGWLSLSDSIEQSFSVVRDFSMELPKEGECTLSSFFGSWAISGDGCGIKITDFLKNHKNNLEQINKNIWKTLSYYIGIETLGNPVFDEKLEKNIQSLLGLSEILTFSLAHFENIMTLLGDTKPEQYMILNQNQDELRANGGFPGSILSFEIYKGRVQKFEKHDVYDYDWKIYPYKEIPPSGLEGYSGNFGIRDANYYPDFRDSMKKIGFFVEKAGFKSVDTMIAINQGIIIEFLKKYGPVKMENYGLIIDDKNFSRIVSTLVEARVFPYKKLDTGHTYQSPKEFLFRFMEAFTKQLAEKRDIFGYLNILVDNFKKHEILIASKNSDTERFLEELGIRETWQSSEGNFIYPIFTSLSANKSDRYMNRNMTIKTITLSGCTVHNSIKLNSEHTITIDEIMKTSKILHDFGIDDLIEQTRLWFIEGNGVNKQYIRFLVPKDSVLDPGVDFKIEEGTLNYMIFSTFHRTEPMKSSVLEFGYATKVPNCVPTIELYTQPGMRGMEIIKQ